MARSRATARQGVVIPAANVQHLMLREDVVAAAREGRFHVWPVSDIDETITLLTGLPAGEPDAKGVVPEGSINYLVAAKLVEMSLTREAYAVSEQGATQRRKKRRVHGGAAHNGRAP